jgi:hypothetical protein
MCIGFWWEMQSERDHYGDLDVCGRLVLRLILERLDGVV